MVSLRKRLPPINSLVVFEAAARSLNFTRAAEELGVTQAAVSRQIAALEAHLNAKLFERLHHALRLTAKGKAFRQVVARSLDSIANSAEAIRQADTEVRVTLFANVAVATFWLNPRLPLLVKRFPETDIRLVASDEDPDDGLDGIDLAILYGDGQWPKLNAELLFGEELFPVCSPDYLRSAPAPQSPADLLRHSLLHIDQHAPDWINWRMWLQSQGVDPPRRIRGPKFNNYALLVDMAVEGRGVGLGTRHLVDRLLAEGALVRALDASLVSERGYYLVTRRDRRLSNEAQAVLRWLRRQRPRNVRAAAR
ncbi:MAG: LysR substrate-binding domain-containing protein [Kiloniellales bacterium]